MYRLTQQNARAHGAFAIRNPMVESRARSGFVLREQVLSAVSNHDVGQLEGALNQGYDEAIAVHARDLQDPQLLDLLRRTRHPVVLQLGEIGWSDIAPMTRLLSEGGLRIERLDFGAVMSDDPRDADHQAFDRFLQAVAAHRELRELRFNGALHWEDSGIRLEPGDDPVPPVQPLDELDGALEYRDQFVRMVAAQAIETSNVDGLTWVSGMHPAFVLTMHGLPSAGQLDALKASGMPYEVRVSSDDANLASLLALTSDEANQALLLDWIGDSQGQASPPDLTRSAGGPQAVIVDVARDIGEADQWLLRELLMASRGVTAFTLHNANRLPEGSLLGQVFKQGEPVQQLALSLDPTVQGLGACPDLLRGLCPQVLTLSNCGVADVEDFVTAMGTMPDALVRLERVNLVARADDVDDASFGVVIKRLLQPPFEVDSLYLHARTVPLPPEEMRAMRGVADDSGFLSEMSIDGPWKHNPHMQDVLPFYHYRCAGPLGLEAQVADMRARFLAIEMNLVAQAKATHWPLL